MIYESINKRVTKYDYVNKYKSLLQCKTSYSVWQKGLVDAGYNYSKPADETFHAIRFVRAVLVYFPIEYSDDWFRDEFKWLYRSWIHMLRYEPPKWRTDLIVFVQNERQKFKSGYFLNQLNCRFENVRTSPKDNPMCTLFEYTPLRLRTLKSISKILWQNNEEMYEYFLNDVDIFKGGNQFDLFYKLLNLTLTNYTFLDSILMAFDGYEYFKSAGYNFLIRSDMDVFLTPLFAKWLPRHCNDFYVGSGGYSTDFNVNRLRRIANNLGLSYANRRDLGSTWYSTPDLFRLVPYLTLTKMAYLSAEEFSSTEREGGQMWPHWHYQVVLLYGQNLALNHLIATEQINVIKLDNQLDVPSFYQISINQQLHIHVYHNNFMFSKIAFHKGEYDSLNPTESDQINLYCLKMALDSKRISDIDLSKMLREQITNKN